MLLDRKTLDAMSDDEVTQRANDARALTRIAPSDAPLYNAFFAPLFREEATRAETRICRGVDAIRDIESLARSLAAARAREEARAASAARFAAHQALFAAADSDDDLPF